MEFLLICDLKKGNILSLINSLFKKKKLPNFYGINFFLNKHFATFSEIQKK
jgi:hypothetical protein